MKNKQFDNKLLQFFNGTQDTKMITKIVWASFAQPMAWLWGRDYEFGANSSTEITFKHT